MAAVGFALTWARPLYQTLIYLVIIYGAIFLPQAVGAAQDSLVRASPDLEDASRGLGQGPVVTLMRVTVPLAVPGLVAGAALVFLSVRRSFRNAPPAPKRFRDAGHQDLELHCGRLHHQGVRGEPGPPRRFHRATLPRDVT